MYISTYGNDICIHMYLLGVYQRVDWLGFRAYESSNWGDCFPGFYSIYYTQTYVEKCL